MPPSYRRRSPAPPRAAWQLRAYFRKRSARKSHIFWSKIVRRYSKKQLFFWDETAKDERAMRRCRVPAVLARASSGS